MPPKAIEPEQPVTQKEYTKRKEKNFRSEYLDITNSHLGTGGFFVQQLLMLNAVKKQLTAAQSAVVPMYIGTKEDR